MDAADEHHRLLVAYKKAEDLLHSLGIETGDGIDTSAVNELRYAGRHVLNGLTAADPDERNREFRRAEDHCERALYEAYDSAIFFYFRSFDQFKEDYARISIVDTIPDFIDIEASMRKARKFLETARREEAKRASYYKQAETQHHTVSAAWNRLDAARGELNKAVESFNRTLANEAEKNAEAAQANAEAASGRKMTIRVSWIVGVVTVIVNVLIQLVQAFMGG